MSRERKHKVPENHLDTGGGGGPRKVPFSVNFGGALKERRRGCAEKRLSKRVFLESPFLLRPLEVCS